MVMSEQLLAHNHRVGFDNDIYLIVLFKIKFKISITELKCSLSNMQARSQ